MKSSFILKFAVHCFLGAALVACSSSSDTGTTTDAGKDGAIGPVTDTAGGGTDTAGGGTDTAGGTDAPKTDAPKADTGGGGDETCGAAAKNTDCQTCCHTNHSAAYDAFVAALTTCGCKAGNCDTDCKTSVCASPPAALDATCNTCLGKVQSGACKADLTTCSTTGPCKEFYDCVVAQDCNSKP